MGWIGSVMQALVDIFAFPKASLAGILDPLRGDAT